MAAIQKTADPGCLTVFDRTHQRVGATCDPTGDPPAPHPIEVQVQGRACMASDALEDAALPRPPARPRRPAGRGLPGAAGLRPPRPADARLRADHGRRRHLRPAAARRGRLLGLRYRAAQARARPGPALRRSRPAHRRPAVRLHRPLRQQRVVRQLRGRRAPARPAPRVLRAVRQLPGADARRQGPAGRDRRPRAGADWAALTVSSTGVSGAGYPGHPQDGQELEAAGGGLVRAIVPRDRPSRRSTASPTPTPTCPATRCASRAGCTASRGRDPGERAISGWTPFRDPQSPRERNGLSPGCP